MTAEPLLLWAALACHGGPAPQTTAATPPNLILVVWESTRADHVSAHGYPLRTTPTLEDLARQGITFQHNLSTAPWTLPSVTSLLTGLAPTVHGVQGYDDQLSPSVPTVAERLRDAGYTTAFLGVNTFFEAGKGLERGFDFYFGQGDVPGLELSQRMLRWLDDRPQDQPFFLYLHIFEPHCPYDPPPEYAHVFDPRPRDLATDRAYTRAEWDRVFGCFRLPAPDRSGEPVLDMNSYLSAYDADLHYTDFLTSTMLQRLQTRDLLDNSMIVMVGDHGEEFLDHGDHGHGRQLFEESVHVPLIIRPAGSPDQRAAFAGRVVQDPTSSLDVTATLLAAAGLPASASPGDGPQGAPGSAPQDLSPAWTDRSTPRAWSDRSIFASTDHEAHLRAVLSHGWKLIMDVSQPTVDPDLPGAPPVLTSPKLFKLDDDPGERHDLAADQKDTVGELIALLRQQEAADRSVAATLGRSARPLDQETEAALRRLGYLEP